MRASCSWFVVIACAVGCGSSTAAPPAPANDASTGGNIPSEAGLLDLPILGDGRVSLGDSRSLAQIGEACNGDGDCDQRGCAQTMDGFPGGYCTPDCKASHVCRAGGSCIALNASRASCYRTCMADTDCRTGYSCRDMGAALTVSGTSKVCYPTDLSLGASPNCDYDKDCPPFVPHCMGGYMPCSTDAATGTGADGAAGEGGTSVSDAAPVACDDGAPMANGTCVP
jgi:hypothetical protein